MADDKVSKSGTTVFNNDDAFHPVKPKYKPPNNKHVQEVITYHPKQIGVPAPKPKYK